MCTKKNFPINTKKLFLSKQKKIEKINNKKNKNIESGCM